METPPVLTKTRIQSGVWEGVLAADPAAEPSLEVTHLDEPLHAVSLTRIDGRAGEWAVRIAIPTELIGDGVQTFLISDAATGARLGAFAIAAGEPLEDDIRAEVDLLRAELDLLKKAFRRHCVETG